MFTGGFFLAANDLFVVQGGNTGKDLSFKEFKRGTSSSRDVAHVSGTSRQFGGGNGVSSSDDGDGSLLLGQVSQDVDKVESSGGELLELEDTHGSVHDDGLARRKGFLLLGGGFGTIVKTHPAIGDLFCGDNLGIGIRGESISDDNVGRKKDSLAKLLGLGQDILGSLNVVVFNKGRTNSVSLGLQECENHTSSDDDGVALVKKGLKDGDLGGDLGSTHDGGHWLLSVLDSSVEVFKFLGKKESRHGRLEELGHTLSRGVGTVGGTEGIVNVKVEGSGKLLNERCFVLLFFLVKTSVFKHDDISFLGGINDLLGFLPDAVLGKGDRFSKKLTHALGTGGKGELVLGTILRASQVRADSDDGTLLRQVFDGGDGRADTGVVGDLLSVKRDVDIATDQDLLSLQFSVGEVLDGLLGIKLEDRRNGASDSESVCTGGGDKISVRSFVTSYTQ